MIFASFHLNKDEEQNQKIHSQNHAWHIYLEYNLGTGSVKTKVERSRQL
jgi:hypothetical protein